MITHTRLYDDAVPFLHQLRSLGMKVALVSNCPDNTRALLAHLNLDQLAHHTILSCEIGFAKPSPEIYEAALAALEVSPTETVMVDDLEEYCGGADTAGVKAIRLAREGQQADARFPVARSLHDVVYLLVQDGLVANGYVNLVWI
jgi:putative hydrolase of the HAD superfamily